MTENAPRYELEAVTDIKPDPRREDFLQASCYVHKYPLTSAEPFRLGRDAERVAFVISEDDMLSRFQAILTWDVERRILSIETRGVLHSYDKPPANSTQVWDEAGRWVDSHVWDEEKAEWIVASKLTGKAKRCVERKGKCTFRVGEIFQIGQTKFVVHDRLSETQVSTQDEHPLNRFNFEGATVRASSIVRSARTQQTLLSQSLRVVMNSMPRVDAVAIVRFAATSGAALEVIESAIRQGSMPESYRFTPSRRLTRQAVLEKRLCLEWRYDPNGESDQDDPGESWFKPSPENGPWALCVPFHDGSFQALYIAGHFDKSWKDLANDPLERVKSELQKYRDYTELLVGMIETRLEVIRLSNTVEVIRRAWPGNLWRFLDDAEELERMLVPKEMEITTLFCDLRNYSLFASQNSQKLLEAQREVAAALNVMSSAITDREGVVSGFRGDAAVGFWGWPRAQKQQIIQAARAAVFIAGRLSTDKRISRCGVALTHGPAVVGRMGAHDLSVVDLYGPAVNLTFRLEAMTKAFGVPIIVSKPIADGIVAADPYGHELRTRLLGRVRAKGFPEPQDAYELYSAQSPSIHSRQQEEWVMAVNAFTAGDWSMALEMLVSLFPDDTVARCLQRVMDKTGWRPPADWDGSFVPPTSEGS